MKFLRGFGGAARFHGLHKGKVFQQWVFHVAIIPFPDTLHR